MNKNKRTIIVTIKDFDEVNNLINQCGGTLVNILPYTRRLQIETTDNEFDLVFSKYETNKHVELVYEETPVQTADFVAAPVSHFYGWSFDDSNKIAECYHLWRQGVFEAHKFSTGFGVHLCISDTGVSSSHPDLNVNIGIAPSMANYGLEFVCWGEELYQDVGLEQPIPFVDHGTDCLGIICALRNNGEGYTGIAPDITPYVVSGNYRSAETGDDCPRQTILIPSVLLEGMFYMHEEYGVRIFTCSWGSYAYNSGVSFSFKQLLDNGCIIACAAMNDGYDLAENPAYPALYDERIFCTSSADKYDNIHWHTGNPPERPYMNYGAAVNMVACTGIPVLRGSWYDEEDMLQGLPGSVGYYDASEGFDVDENNGSSFAAPQVAAVAALVWSIDPKFSADRVRTIVRRSYTKPIGTNFYDYFTNPDGIGIMDAGMAVKDALVNSKDYDGTIYPHISLYGPGTIYGITNNKPTIELNGIIYIDIRGYTDDYVNKVELLIGETVVYSGAPGILSCTGDSSGNPETVTVKVYTPNKTAEEIYGGDIIVSSITNVEVIELHKQTGWKRIYLG